MCSRSIPHPGWPRGGFGRPPAVYSEDGGITWQAKTGDWFTVFGTTYYGIPGTCGSGASVTFTDTQSTVASAAIPDDAVLSCRAAKSGPAGPCLSTYDGATGVAGDPINTRTGGFDYAIADLEIQTSTGLLVFQRSYSSLATTLSTQLLGFGWTHNHEYRLIFPGDPGGQPGKVLFKAYSANRYEFTDNGDGTYTAAPGLLVALTRDDGPPVTYSVVDPGQAQYAFDALGKLTTWEDPQGHALAIYDGRTELTA
jgi:YD repeat-containing protein